MLEAEVESLTTELNSTRMGFDGLQSEVTELQVKSASKNQEYQGVLRQLEMVSKSLNDLDLQLARMSEEAQGYSSQMTESQLTLEEKKIEFERLLDEVETLKLQVGRTKDEYEVMSESARTIEDEVNSSQRARNERQHKMNDSQLKLEQAKMKEQYLIDQVRERYMLNLPDVVDKYANPMVISLMPIKSLKTCAISFQRLVKLTCQPSKNTKKQLSVMNS